MLKNRIIPCLDVKDGRVVKGINFVELKDAGDPVEQAKIYSDGGADEICFLDITASNENRETIIDIVRKTAKECFVPLTVGGGVRSVEDISKLLNCGADKVSINTAAVNDKQVIVDSSKKFGSQCIVVAIDAKKNGDVWEIYTHGGRNKTGIDALKFAKEMERSGAGELLVTSMDRDGTQVGYDIDLMSKITSAVNIPVNSTEKEVKVYSGRHYNTDRSVYKKFADETGIKVRLIEAAGISLIERLKREGKNSQADLILLVDAARITNAAKAGLLQPITSSNLENDVPVGLKDPNKEWYALTRRVRVMVANPKVVDVSKINDYTDLADPSFKGKVCLRNRKSPYNQSLVANQIINKGESETKAWLSGMISNVSQPFFPGDISLIRAVSKKKCGVGIVNHYYEARMLAGVNGRRDALYAKKTSVITPNPAHVNISAGGLAKYATNKNEAIKLLEYLASPKGSKGLAAPTFEHPLKEVNQNPIVKNFGEFSPDEVTVEELGANNSLAIKLMKEAGWD